MSSLLCKWFGIGCPPKPQPPQPPTNPEKAVAVVVFDVLGPVEGAKVYLDGDPNSFPLTNGDGYTIDNHCPASLTASQLTVVCQGYYTYSQHVDLVSGEQTLHATIKRVAAPLPSPDKVSNIKTNLGSLKDSHGRVMLSWFFPLLSQDDQADWIQVWKDHGLTHVVLCPVMSYPGYWIGGDDWRGQPGRFADAVKKVLDLGFVPIVFMSSGDGGTGSDIQAFWPGLTDALKPYAPYIWVTCGFEVVGPGAGWTSKQLSDGLTFLHTHLPEARLGVHLQPERATGASYPVEPDDPWQGDEAGFWVSHGGEHAQALLYQTPHGDKLLNPNLTGPSSWEDRWIEILDRLGTGSKGWRLVPLCFFETTTYDYYHGGCSDADTQRLNQRAQALAAARGVPITYGSWI